MRQGANPGHPSRSSIRLGYAGMSLHSILIRPQSGAGVEIVN
jgi:hypothetical protein